MLSYRSDFWALGCLKQLGIMAPKAKAKPKTKAAAKAKALLAPDDKAAEATGGMAPVQEAKALEMVQEVNREHLQKLEGSIQTILSHPLFSNIMHESPLKIDKTAGASEAGMRAWFHCIF